MRKRMLERTVESARLRDAVAEAAGGRGTVALVTGEAGIGKTTLLRLFVDALAPQVRTIWSTCDDLIAPRTLGPLLDAVSGADGSLLDLVQSDPGVRYPAFLAELRRHRPTVVVVEDLHWADDATFDLLLYAVRRFADVPAVLVLSYRDTAVDARHPLRRLLGALPAGAVVRLALRPLSPEAVAELAAGTGRNAGKLHAVTGGNPFFVTEALAAAPDVLPESIVEAVLARCRLFSAPCREALDQLSVIPSRLAFDQADTVLGPAGLAALAEAEQAGVVQVSAEGVAFRHELARRAVEQSLPKLARRRLNQAVVAALTADRQPDLARLVHHAIEAGDAETVVAVGPGAARAASQVGSHRQALAIFETLLGYLDRFNLRQQAALVDDYGWELHNAHRFADAVAAGQRAMAGYDALGDTAERGRCLVRLSRYLFLSGDTDAAEQAAREAVRILRAHGDRPAVAHALIYLGALQALTDAPQDAEPVLARAGELATETGRGDLVVLAWNYLGIARAELGRSDGVDLLRRSLAGALAGGQQEYVARGYTNLAELLFRLGRLDELAECVEDGLRYTQERGFWSHVYNLELHRCLRLVRLGDWAGARDGLCALVEGTADPGMLYVYSVPWLGRLLARQGDPGAGGLIRQAWERARRQRLLIGWAYAGMGLAEWAWLAGDRCAAEAVAAEALPRLTSPGGAPFREELTRYLARCGVVRLDAQATSHVPADPYERALARADAGDPGAVADLDRCGAPAAAARVRETLRESGLPVPRGRRPSTRSNPAGLTDRQLDVLALLGQGRTNAAIAAELTLSVRTVEHHVAAILNTLGVPSRQQAALAAAKLGVAVPAARRGR